MPSSSIQFVSEQFGLNSDGGEILHVDDEHSVAFNCKALQEYFAARTSSC